FPTRRSSELGRQARESLAKALHPAPLVVHRDQQSRLAQRMDLGAKRLDLWRGFVVAREQDHAAHLGMQQAFPVLRVQVLALDVEHHAAEGAGSIHRQFSSTTIAQARPFSWERLRWCRPTLRPER